MDDERIRGVPRDPARGVHQCSPGIFVYGEASQPRPFPGPSWPFELAPATLHPATELGYPLGLSSGHPCQMFRPNPSKMISAPLPPSTLRTYSSSATYRPARPPSSRYGRHRHSNVVRQAAQRLPLGLRYWCVHAPLLRNTPVMAQRVPCRHIYLGTNCLLSL